MTALESNGRNGGISAAYPALGSCRLEYYNQDAAGSESQAMRGALARWEISGEHPLPAYYPTAQHPFKPFAHA